MGLFRARVLIIAVSQARFFFRSRHVRVSPIDRVPKHGEWCTVCHYFSIPLPKLISKRPDSFFRLFFGRYYRNETSTRAVVSDEYAATITKSARLDILWPTAYINSLDTKVVLVNNVLV